MNSPAKRCLQPRRFVLDDCDTGADYDVTESSTDMGNGEMVIERIYSTWDGCGNTREFHQTITVTLVVPGCTDARSVQLRRFGG